MIYDIDVPPTQHKPHKHLNRTTAPKQKPQINKHQSQHKNHHTQKTNPKQNNPMKHITKPKKKTTQVPPTTNTTN